MNDPLKMLDMLALRARQEAAPCAYISIDSICIVRNELGSPEAPLTIFAAAAALVAVIILVSLAIPTSASGVSSDVLSAFFEVATLNIQ